MPAKSKRDGLVGKNGLPIWQYAFTKNVSGGGFYWFFMSDEHRKGLRRRAFKGGSISFDRAAGIDCIVRNLSKGGAMLEVESPLGIPDDFTLVIKPEYLRRECHVVWRKAKQIGVRFV